MANTTKNTTTGLDPKVAAALSYVLGWITGLIFLLIEKDEYVRFHAIQSILTSVAITIFYSLPPVYHTFGGLISLLSFILFVFLIVKAAQGEKYKLPLIGDYAEKWAKSA